MDEFKQRDLVEMLDGIILYDVTWILWMNRLDRLGLDGFWTFLFGLVALGWLSAWFGLGWPGHPPLFCEETTVFFSSVYSKAWDVTIGSRQFICLWCSTRLIQWVEAAGFWWHSAIDLLIFRQCLSDVISYKRFFPHRLVVRLRLWLWCIYEEKLKIGMSGTYCIWILSDS